MDLELPVTSTFKCCQEALEYALDEPLTIMFYSWEPQPGQCYILPGSDDRTTVSELSERANLRSGSEIRVQIAYPEKVGPVYNPVLLQAWSQCPRHTFRSLAHPANLLDPLTQDEFGSEDEVVELPCHHLVKDHELTRAWFMERHQGCPFCDRALIEQQQ